MNYLILATGRARAGVLCSYLRGLGCGDPDEYYEKVRFDAYKMDISGVKDYFESKRVNGIFGMRMVWSHIRTMHESLGIGLKEFIDECLPDPYYIHVERDPWRQAVESSLYQNDKAEKIPYDQIKARIGNILMGHQAYRDFFDKYGITTLGLRSEVFQHSPEAACRAIHDFIGRDYPEGVKLRNHFHDKWSLHPRIDEYYKRCVGGLLTFAGMEAQDFSFNNEVSDDYRY